mmetsp:Transcript_13341/g.32592  ORF Transcript_13341/g.32592 Transcript_13341/m.32592 type:complete len:315 (+) Transcript_13341:571-1515(+)
MHGAGLRGLRDAAHDDARVLEALLCHLQAVRLLLLAPALSQRVDGAAHRVQVRVDVALPLVERQLRVVQAHLRHLGPDHAPARGVRKVKVVVVADEGGRVGLGQRADLGGVLRAGAIRRGLGRLDAVRGLEPGQVLGQRGAALQARAAERGVLGVVGVAHRLLQRLVHHLGLGQEARVALARGHPRLRLGCCLLASLLGCLVLGVQLHGHHAHLIDEAFLLLLLLSSLGASSSSVSLPVSMAMSQNDQPDARSCWIGPGWSALGAMSTANGHVPANKHVCWDFEADETKNLDSLAIQLVVNNVLLLKGSYCSCV